MDEAGANAPHDGELLVLDGSLLVLFDGQCGLCNGAVRWLLRHDWAGRLVFATQGSAEGARWREPGGGADDSIVVVARRGTPGELVLVRSDAVLAVLRELPQPWPALAAIARIVPRPLRDAAYRLVARTRYRIWGRLEACPLPTEAERGRFL